MRFSIITPSYNQGKYIKQTLDSVLSSQQGCDIEHIVIDGGSQDETTGILKEYADIYPNLTWSSTPDQGQSDAINKGIKIATGEIIAYINSDDYYLPNTFKSVLNIFENHPEVDFVYSDIFLVNSSEKKLRRVKSLRTSLWHHIYSFPFPQQSCFWRRRVLELVPEFNINNITCMDAEYFAHVLSHKVTFCRVSKPLACFRIHPESITGSQRLASTYTKDRRKLENHFFSHTTSPRIIRFVTGKIYKHWQLIIRSNFEIFKT